MCFQVSHPAKHVKYQLHAEQAWGTRSGVLSPWEHPVRSGRGSRSVCAGCHTAALTPSRAAVRAARKGVRERHGGEKGDPHRRLATLVSRGTECTLSFEYDSADNCERKRQGSRTAWELWVRTRSKCRHKNTRLPPELCGTWGRRRNPILWFHFRGLQSKNENERPALWRSR